MTVDRATVIVRPRLFVLAAVASIVLLAAACSDRGGAGPSAPSAAVQDTPTAALTATASLPPSPGAAAVTVAPSPTPTAAPSTTPAAPSARATAPAPSIDAAALTETAFGHLSRLAGEYGPRTSGTDREAAAARYIAAELARAGFSASLQEFPVHVTPGHGRDLEITAPLPLKLETVAMAGSGEGAVTGRLVYVGLVPEDTPQGGLAGAIVLARRGLIPFGEKAENARRAGGAGLVVFNSEQGLFAGNLGGQAAIPVVSISDADGQTLLELLTAGPVTASLTLRSEDRTSRNIIATLNERQGPVVVLGGHYDSVPESLGANDNASGTSVLLAMAGEIARRQWPFEVRIIAFGAEELGLLGSRHYVDSLPPAERARIAAMLNFDALGTGALAATGDRSLLDSALSIARELGVPLVETGEPPNASSDHASFRAAGVPVLFIAATDFSRIHTADDTIEHVDRAQLGQAAAIGIKALERLAAASRP